MDNYNSLFPFSCFFLSFPTKGIIYPVCEQVQLILSYNMTLSIYIGDSSLSGFSEKPYNAYQMKLFEKEFCFFSAFDSLNLLKQKRYSSSYFRQKKNKHSIYNLLIFYFFPLFFTLFVHNCTSFHVKVGSFRIFSTAFSSVSKVFLIKKKVIKIFVTH